MTFLPSLMVCGFHFRIHNVIIVLITNCELVFYLKTVKQGKQSIGLEISPKSWKHTLVAEKTSTYVQNTQKTYLTILGWQSSGQTKKEIGWHNRTEARKQCTQTAPPTSSTKKMEEKRKNDIKCYKITDLKCPVAKKLEIRNNSCEYCSYPFRIRFHFLLRKNKFEFHSF